MRKEVVFYESNNTSEEAAIESLLYTNEDLTRDEITEEMINNEIDFLNELHADDLRANLSYVSFSENLICIADLGLWHGRRGGYKELGNKGSDVLSAFSGDFIKLYSNGYDLCGSDSHHDGTNYYTFREFKPDVNQDLFMSKIYNGTVTKNDICRYTRSILKAVEGNI